MEITIALESTEDRITLNSRIRPHIIEFRDTEWWIFIPTADEQEAWPDRELYGGPGNENDRKEATEFDPLEWAK